MRSFVALALILAACGGDDGAAADDGPTPDGQDNACPIEATVADAGALTAMFAQRCNVSGSMGARKWYRIAATLPGSTDIVQIELYDQAGAFTGGAVKAGTFPVDPDFATCGVCVRAQGNKGEATTKEYFATAGTVTITAAPGATGSTFTASLSGVTFGEIDATSHANVPGGCATDVAGASLTGTLVDHGGTGGGTGGGGGGGTGTCASTIGDPEKI